MPSPVRLVRARRPRTHVRHARLLATATALVLATACGSGTEGARSEGPAPSASGAGSSEGRDAGLKYAACMREHNVDASDPDAESGLVKLPSDVPQSQIERAEKACGQNPTGGAKKADIPDEVLNDPDVQALRLKLDTCMRENGYEKPTPDAQGNVTVTMTSEMRAAQKACRAEEKRLNDRMKALKEKVDK